LKFPLSENLVFDWSKKRDIQQEDVTNKFVIARRSYFNPKAGCHCRVKACYFDTICKEVFKKFTSTRASMIGQSRKTLLIGSQS